MKPEYVERCKVERTTDKNSTEKLKTITLRLNEKQTSFLEIFAKAEGDTFAGLMREGILRVIDDRFNDGIYMDQLAPEARASLTASADEQIQFLEGALETVKAQREASTNRAQSSAAE